ncbi:MAG: RNA-binding protein, partial [Pyrinomonadaceae bacterium]|nr:RNA-binding protein [Pyrinomonadaceae bacterium]
ATGAVFTFGSMTAQERRVIHVTLAESEDLQTESVGEGPERKLRVGLKKSNA